MGVVGVQGAGDVGDLTPLCVVTAIGLCRGLEARWQWLGVAACPSFFLIKPVLDSSVQHGVTSRFKCTLTLTLSNRARHSYIVGRRPIWNTTKLDLSRTTEHYLTY